MRVAAPTHTVGKAGVCDRLVLLLVLELGMIAEGSRWPERRSSASALSGVTAGYAAATAAMAAGALLASKPSE